jgi:putative tributyrin esterase
MQYRWSSHILQSKALDGRRVFRITLPDQPGAAKLGLLVLLHGIYGAETDWIDRGGLVECLERLTAERKIGPIAVLTPSDGLAGIGTGYLNWSAGSAHRYEDYILEDLLNETEQKWPVGGRRERRAIAGFSMGGFGAVRFALKHPYVFGSASSLNGFFDAAELEKLVGTKTYQMMFKNSSKRIQQNSPLFMNISTDILPKLLIDCGVSDAFIGQNRDLNQRLLELEIPHEYVEREGDHSLEYWKTHILAHLIFHGELMK